MQIPPVPEAPRAARVATAAAVAAAFLVPVAASAHHDTPAPAAVAPTPSIFPYPMRVERLPNGLQLVVVPMKSPGLVAYYTLVRVGSRNEVEKGRSGFAHFFEHMMFRGTKSYSADDRNAFLMSIGADDNGFTTDDFTCYTVFGGNHRLEELIRIEADRFQNLEYGPTEFKTEANAVLGEYNKNASNPTEKMHEILSGLAFTRHTYRHTTIGFEEDIKAMPKGFDYSRTFFKRYYQPDNTTLVVAGDVDPAAVTALVTKYYGGWKGKTKAAPIPTEPPQTKERVREHVWDTDTAPRIMAGYHTPAQNLETKDAAVQYVLGALLLGPASTLYRELVLEKQKVESLQNWTYDHRDPNLFLFLVTLKEEKDRAEVWAAVQREIDALAQGKVDAALLSDVISNLRYGVLTGLETPNAVADTLVGFMGPNGDPAALDKTLSMVALVTASDVTGFAKRWLRNENRTVVHLRSKAGAVR